MSTPASDERIRSFYGEGLSPDEADQLARWTQNIEEGVFPPTPEQIAADTGRRAENNARFVGQVTASLAGVELVHEERDRWYPVLVDSLQTRRATNLRFGVELDGRTDGDRARQAMQWRSSLVWLPVEPDEVLDITSDRSSFDSITRVTHDNSVQSYPFAVVGFDLNTDDKSSHVLLSPLKFRRRQTVHKRHSQYRSERTTLTFDPPEDPEILQVEMAREQGSVLNALLRVLRQEDDLRNLDVGRLHDERGVTRLLTKENHLNIDMQEVWRPGSFIHDHPRSIDELDDEDFDVRIVDRFQGELPDEVMARFDVLAWLGRLGYVFDSRDAFMRAEEDWARVAGRPGLLDEYVGN